MQATSVLVVDDQPDFCELLGRMLRRAGYDSTCLFGGQEAVDYLQDHTPNLIILDMMMPGMDGLDVLQRIRATAQLADVPVIIFSAVADPVIRARALGAGATDWWLKANVDFKGLPSRIENYLHAH